VRGAALESIAHRNPAIGLKLTTRFLGEGGQARVSAANALGALLASKETHDDARALLEKLVRGEHAHRIRMAALAALAEGNAAHDLAVELLAKEESSGVLDTALDALAKELESDASLEEAFFKCYVRTRDRHDLLEARENLVTALGERGPALGTWGKKCLWFARSNPDPAPSVAAAVAKALARVTGEKASEPVARPRERKLAVEPHDFAGKTPILELETSRGPFTVELYPDDAPVHCANVWQLASRGFYDGLSWHRVVSSFVIQGGDPKGDGSGDAGYNIPDEINARPYLRGTLGMPKTAIKDTGGCQLFFTHVRTPHLDGRYTVFGRIRAGFSVLDLIEEGDKITRVQTRLE
jgi:peptidyl-prolyl cis-trans isomerase B (cyclophilin B)